MTLSRTAWVAAGLVARLMMIAVLAVSVQLKYANHTRFDYRGVGNYSELQSYSYLVAAAVIGMAGSVLQLPVAVYLLCKGKRMMPRVLILDISMYFDIEVTVVLASGVGAGFGATDDVLQYIDNGRWDGEMDTKQDLIDYYHKGIVPIVFLLVGMVLSMCATVVSARLRARATNDLANV